MRPLTILIYTLMTGLAQAQEPVRLGIFGMVDSISPLVVAGQQIEGADRVPVISILGPQQKIAEGDTLAVVVRASDAGLVAERILEIYPIVGPVRDVTGDTARIMGSSVHIPPDADIKVGQWLAISGFWSGAKAITSNFRRFGGGIAQLAGVVDRDNSALGGSTVSGAQAPLDGYGSDVWVFSGAPEGDGLQVRLTSKGVFGGKVDLALWQGYASQPIASQTYMIHGSGVIGTARDAQMPAVGALIIRCVHQGRVVNAAPEALEAAFKALGCARRIRAD